ncbi:Y-family DNA polymerase [Pedobacter hartonius]|uniref:Protein ImuB n=1 Tax=Pedobacter hartonius TaxID=425514 RepID=A0A1H4G5E0_9SPHI|nr:DNA polymerase Y family protein [Pedobacter hartonius]SEB04250.1 protein ImuB [Pedobacter hartonius]
MQKRYASIWFPYLISNWLVLRRPALKDTAFVITSAERGRALVKALSEPARTQGVTEGMSLADAKAIVPGLQVFSDKAGREARLLRAIGEWCIRYTPFVALDLPDGLILDTSGCPHLWGAEEDYLKEIVSRLKTLGYEVRAAIADTIGTAWAVARFGEETRVINSGEQATALLSLPPSALRLETVALQRLQKLGLYQISSFIHMPRAVLRRRFGADLLLKLARALGQDEERIQPLQIMPPYQERLPCLEPIRTAIGIEIAIKKLLEALCKRLQGEGKGLRTAVLTCYRIDGKVIQAEIGTNSPSHHITHLFKLFLLKIPSIEPALGIELFVMEAPKTEDVSPLQEALWIANPGLDDQGVSELLDRLAVKVGAQAIHRYLPDEHFWPERSLKPAASIQEKTTVPWKTSRPRPTQLLAMPVPIEVSAPIPDYPPMLFIYKGKRHMIKKADGPERIAQEWWLQQGEHRDYYYVEDEDGQRYWLFRSGHYSEQGSQWFIHGFFA